MIGSKIEWWILCVEVYLRVLTGSVPGHKVMCWVSSVHTPLLPSIPTSGIKTSNPGAIYTFSWTIFPGHYSHGRHGPRCFIATSLFTCAWKPRHASRVNIGGVSSHIEPSHVDIIIIACLQNYDCVAWFCLCYREYKFMVTPFLFYTFIQCKSVKCSVFWYKKIKGQSLILNICFFKLKVNNDVVKGSLYTLTYFIHVYFLLDNIKLFYCTKMSSASQLYTRKTRNL